MDPMNLQNTQNKMKSIKGNTAAGNIALGCLMTLFCIGGFYMLISEGQLTGLLVGLLFAAAAYAFWSSIPKEKKAVRESWGALAPDLVNRIEMDAAQAPIIGNAFVTRDAVVKKSSQGPIVIPAKDIMWIYGKETTHKMYGVISTGKTFNTMIVDRTGTVTELQGTNTKAKLKEGEAKPTDSELRTLFEILKPGYPGILFGYKPEIAAMANKQNIGKLAELVDRANAENR